MKIASYKDDVLFSNTKVLPSKNIKEEFLKDQNFEITSKKDPDKHDLNQSKNEKPEKTIHNKISTIIQKPFDIENSHINGSTILISQNFYICTEQNKIYLSNEDEKTMLEALKQTFPKFLNQYEKFLKSAKSTETTINKNDIIKMIYKFPNFLNKKIKLYKEIISKSQNENQAKLFEEKLKNCELYKQELEESLINEKNIIKINHKNCLKIKWFGDFSSYYVFISDVCNKKDMKTWITNFHNKKILKLNESMWRFPWISSISETFLKYFTCQMISLLDCFKEMRIVHGNINLSNILLTKDFQLKLTDFACSRFLLGNEMFKLNKYEHEVDIANQPPEYFRDMNYVEARDAHKIDIFSFGCCLYEMATGEPLFNLTDDCSNNKERILNMIKIIQNIPEFLNKKIKRSSEFIFCIHKMLEAFEKGRINLNELKEMPWISSKSPRLSIKNIEDRYKHDNDKFVMEMMKADHITYNKIYCEDFCENNNEFLLSTEKTNYSEIKLGGKKNIKKKKCIVTKKFHKQKSTPKNELKSRY